MSAVETCGFVRISKILKDLATDRPKLGIRNFKKYTKIPEWGDCLLHLFYSVQSYQILSWISWSRKIGRSVEDLSKKDKQNKNIDSGHDSTTDDRWLGSFFSKQQQNGKVDILWKSLLWYTFLSWFLFVFPKRAETGATAIIPQVWWWHWRNNRSGNIIAYFVPFLYKFFLTLFILMYLQRYNNNFQFLRVWSYVLTFFAVFVLILVVLFLTN